MQLSTYQNPYAASAMFRSLLTWDGSPFFSIRMYYSMRCSDQLVLIINKDNLHRASSCK